MKSFLVKNHSLFLIFIWLYFLSSINSPPFHKINFNFSSILTFVRGISPLVIFIFSIVYFFYNKIYERMKFSLLEILLLIYFFSQILSHIYFNHNIFSLDLYWPIAGISLIIFFKSAFFQNNQNLKNFILITLVLIFIFCTIITMQLIWEFYFDMYFSDQHFYHTSWYGGTTISENAQLFGQEHPRTSGYGRLLIILFLYFFISYIYHYEDKFFKNKNKIKNIFFLILLCSLSFCIWHVQNRAVLLFFFCFLGFLLLPIDYLIYKKKIKIIFVVFFIPFCLHLYDPVFRIQLIQKIIEKRDLNVKNLEDKYLKPSINKSHKLKSDNVFFDLDNIFFDKDGPIVQSNRWIKDIVKEDSNIKNYTSGRWDLWVKATSKIKINLIGYGPQADRILLNQNVSNLLLYSFLCGGFLSFISIIILYFSVIYKLLLAVFKYNLFKMENNLFPKFSFFIISFFLVRSLFEVSFGIFSIDMIFFIMSLYLMESFLKNPKKIP